MNAATIVADVAGLSDVGRVRANNEDQFVIARLEKTMIVDDATPPFAEHGVLHSRFRGRLLAVADGMGGHAAGEDASAAAVSAVANYVLNTMPWFFRLADHGEDDLVEELTKAVDRAQATIQAAAEERPERRGMGTTLTLAYLLWPRLYVVHVGDTRCYVQHGGTLSQITTDHTLVQHCVDEGLLTREEAAASHFGGMLLRSLGGSGGTVVPDVYKARLSEGDALLLCTDGLTRHVRDERIRELLSAADDAATTCRRLVAEANAAGGEDNITVVVAFFRAAPA